MQQASTLPGCLLTSTEILHLKEIIYPLFSRPTFSKITNNFWYLTENGRWFSENAENLLFESQVS